MPDGSVKTTFYNSNHEVEKYTIQGEDENGNFFLREYDENDQLVSES